MDHVQFPWQPLGALLVERGLLTADELEQALAEQRRTGRVLGQVLVSRGYVSGSSLVQVLAEQHGVGLRPSAEARAAQTHTPWRPLGQVLVDKGFVTEKTLEEVLAEQKRHPTRRLGEILVAGSYVSGSELALALADQHGVELSGEEELETVVEPSTGLPAYRVYEVAYGSSAKRGDVLYECPSFLEAADFACDYVQRDQPAALEIEKVDGAARETVWTYSEARASAEASTRERLVGTFGFDPVRWDPARPAD